MSAFKLLTMKRDRKPVEEATAIKYWTTSGDEVRALKPEEAIARGYSDADEPGSTGEDMAKRQIRCWHELGQGIEDRSDDRKRKGMDAINYKDKEKDASINRLRSARDKEKHAMRRRMNDEIQEKEEDIESAYREKIMKVVVQANEDKGALETNSRVEDQEENDMLAQCTGNKQWYQRVIATWKRQEANRAAADMAGRDEGTSDTEVQDDIVDIEKLRVAASAKLEKAVQDLKEYEEESGPKNQNIVDDQNTAILLYRTLLNDIDARLRNAGRWPNSPQLRARRQDQEMPSVSRASGSGGQETDKDVENKDGDGPEVKVEESDNEEEPKGEDKDESEDEGMGKYVPNMAEVEGLIRRGQSRTPYTRAQLLNLVDLDKGVWWMGAWHRFPVPTGTSIMGSSGETSNMDRGVVQDTRWLKLCTELDRGRDKNRTDRIRHKVNQDLELSPVASGWYAGTSAQDDSTPCRNWHRERTHKSSVAVQITGLWAGESEYAFLERLWSRFGPMVATMYRRERDLRPQGTCVVQFLRKDDAARCVREMNGMPVQGFTDGRTYWAGESSVEWDPKMFVQTHHPASGLRMVWAGENKEEMCKRTYCTGVAWCSFLLKDTNAKRGWNTDLCRSMWPGDDWQNRVDNWK